MALKTLHDLQSTHRDGLAVAGHLKPCTVTQASTTVGFQPVYSAVILDENTHYSVGTMFSLVWRNT